MAFTERYRHGAYVGPRSAEGPLTWSQQEIWLSILEPALPAGRTVNPSAEIEIPRGVGLQQVIDALVQVIGHHESLRTEYIVRNGTCSQAVHAQGVQDVRIHELSAEEDLHQHALLVVAEYDAVPFRWAGPQSVFATILVQSGRPRSIVLSVCHLSVDVLAMQNLEENVRRVIKCSSLVPERLQPLDQVAQQKAGFQEMRQLTEQHWTQLLLRAPETCLDHPASGRPEGEWIAVKLDSVRLAETIHRASRRARVTVTSLISAAIGRALMANSGHPRYTYLTTCHNRFTRTALDSVSQQSQQVLTEAADAGRTFYDLARSVQSSLFAAYRIGSFDPRIARRVQRAIETRRGARIELGVVNILSSSAFSARQSTADRMPCDDSISIVPSRRPGRRISHHFQVLVTDEKLHLELHVNRSALADDRARTVVESFARTCRLAAAGDFMTDRP